MNKRTQNQILREVGTKAELARLVSKATGKRHTRQAIYEWFVKGRIPKAKVTIVSKLTGIPPEKLRRPL